MNKTLSITLTYWHIIYFFVAVLITASVWTSRVDSQIKELPVRITATEERLNKQDVVFAEIKTTLANVQYNNVQIQKDLNDIRNYILAK